MGSRISNNFSERLGPIKKSGKKVSRKSNKGPFLYYVRAKGWVGGIAKYLLFLTGVGGWFEKGQKHPYVV